MSPLHPSLPAVVLCAMVLSLPGIAVAQTTSSTSSRPGVNPQTENQQNSIEVLPDSPGTIWAKSQAPGQQSTSAQTSGTPSDSQPKQDEKLQRPVGTAAAEAPKVSGVTAAQPAGAAIAPAKQRRVRTLVLKVGAILGASAAIGTVVALSAATPSKPPGAH